MGRVVSDAAASKADFVVYSTTFCPYCVAVKRLLDSKGLTYDEFNFDHEPDARHEVVAETGHRTVPVVIDNRGKILCSSVGLMKLFSSCVNQRAEDMLR